MRQTRPLHLDKLHLPRDTFTILSNHARQMISLLWKYSCLWTVVFRDEYCEEPSRNRPDDVTASQINSAMNTWAANKPSQFSQWMSFFLNSGEQWINTCKMKEKWNANKVISLQFISLRIYYNISASKDLLSSDQLQIFHDEFRFVKISWNNFYGPDVGTTDDKGIIIIDT
jgi:hypothetical protein